MTNNKASEKVYLIDFHNGESWSDYSTWYDKKVYTDKKDCEKTLIENGFVFNEKSEHYEKIDTEFMHNIFATIEKLELVS